MPAGKSHNDVTHAITSVQSCVGWRRAFCPDTLSPTRMWPLPSGAEIVQVREHSQGMEGAELGKAPEQHRAVSWDLTGGGRCSRPEDHVLTTGHLLLALTTVDI